MITVTSSEFSDNDDKLPFLEDEEKREVKAEADDEKESDSDKSLQPKSANEKILAESIQSTNQENNVVIEGFPPLPAEVQSEVNESQELELQMKRLQRQHKKLAYRG